MPLSYRRPAAIPFIRLDGMSSLEWLCHFLGAGVAPGALLVGAWTYRSNDFLGPELLVLAAWAAGLFGLIGALFLRVRSWRIRSHEPLPEFVLFVRRRIDGREVEEVFGCDPLADRLMGALWPSTALAFWRPGIGRKGVFNILTHATKRAKYPSGVDRRTITAAALVDTKRDTWFLVSLVSGPARRRGDVGALLTGLREFAGCNGARGLRAYSSAPCLTTIADRTKTRPVSAQFYLMPLIASLFALVLCRSTLMVQTVTPLIPLSVAGFVTRDPSRWVLGLNGYEDLFIPIAGAAALDTAA